MIAFLPKYTTLICTMYVCSDKAVKIAFLLIHKHICAPCTHTVHIRVCTYGKADTAGGLFSFYSYVPIIFILDYSASTCTYHARQKLIYLILIFFQIGRKIKTRKVARGGNFGMS
jgi:hypothetical protein